MNIIFIGPPCSGKGTQTQLLGKKLNLPVFSMGALIREARKNGDPKVIEGFNNYSMKGLHLPIELKFDLLKEKLDKIPDGFILDNFPATKDDLGVFLSYLKEKSKVIDKVFCLNISEEGMERRVISRGRDDDQLQIILQRRKAQDKDRIPVIGYFRNQGILEEINSERSIEEVHQEILRRL